MPEGTPADRTDRAAPGPATLGEALREAARRWPDAPALLSETARFTWAGLDAEVDRLAALFAGIGLRRGEPVGFLITKRPEVVTGFLALARLGAIAAPVNFKLHPDHIRDQFRTASIRTVLVESALDPVLRTVLPELPDPRRIVYVDGPGRHGASWTGQAPAAAPPAVDVGPDDPCYYNYTSGTTGRPKGAVTTHRNILENARATAEALDFRREDVFLGMFSVFAHPHELFHRSLVTGTPFVILDTLSPRITAATIRRFGVTWMMAVPSFYEMLHDHVVATGERLDGLRVLESGGAFVGADTLERMERSFGARFLPVWGCTEATGVALANGPGERVPGATGRPVPGYAVRVVDEAGRDLPPGEVGEMLIRGPAVVSGYVNNPDETAAVFRDGWYHTRDLVRRDAGGFVHFVGRRSEMLKIGGIRVYPLEIETVLGEHPEVREVVVVRAEERVRGEIARAVVRLAPGSTVTARDLKVYCRERLAVYKVPRVVEIWREIPKLPNGKIDKRAILAVPLDPTRDER